MCTPVLADIDQLAVLACTPIIGEHSDECLAFNESRPYDPVCIEVDCTRYERAAPECEVELTRTRDVLPRIAERADSLAVG